MYNLQDQQSNFIVVPFFILLVVLGAFFLLNIVLAVVAFSLSQNDSLEMANENQAKENIAISLKRKEKQLLMEEKEKFQNKIRPAVTSEESSSFSSN